MARKNAKKKPVSKTPARRTTLPPKAVAKTPVRNTSIPKTVTPTKAAAASQPRIVTHEMISVRAFEISCGPNCGSEMENWFRAERELRGGI
jgi:hypothetical protein